MITLKGIAWDHPRATAGLIAVNAAVSEALGDACIAWDVHSLQDFSAASLAETAARYDLILYDHPFSGDAARGLLVDLSRVLPAEILMDLRADTVGFGVDLFDYDGGVWGLPIDAACQVAAFRPDLCARAGLDEGALRHAPLAAVIGRLAAQDLRLAISFSGVGSFMCFLSYCHQLGAQPFADGRMVPDSIGLKAIGLMQLVLAACPREVLDWDSITCLEAMAQRDDLAYCPTIFGFAPYSHDAYGGANGRHPLVFTQPPLPPEGVRQTSIIGGAGIGVSALRPYIDKAARAVAILMSRKMQRDMALAMGQPGRRSVWQDTEVNARSRDFFANTLPSIEQGYIRPRHAGWVPRQDEAGVVLSRMLRQGRSAKDILAAMETVIFG
ncbi:MAG: hypothetical protein ACO1OK_01255 [Devosia sp.]